MRFLIEAQAWLLIITTVAGVIIALVGSIVVMRLILRDAKKKLVGWFIFVTLLMAWITLVLTIVVSLIKFDVASAAENPATAPAESAITVKGYTCPTEFNPDDSAWALNRIESAEKKIADNLLVIEHIRVLSHMWLPKCAVRLYSYGSLGDSDGKRILAVIKSPTNIIAFLLTERGWESGDNVETFTTECDTDTQGCKLTFALYRNKELVTARTIFVRQFSHFREPVE